MSLVHVNFSQSEIRTFIPSPRRNSQKRGIDINVRIKRLNKSRLTRAGQQEFKLKMALLWDNDLEKIQGINKEML